MYILGILVWISVVVFVARLATVRVKDPILRAMLVIFAVPLSFALALADEIVGKFQFDRLCEEAKEVKIHGTHPVGEELYTPEGKWKLREVLSEQDRAPIRTVYESLIRWDSGNHIPEVVEAAIPVRKYNTKIYDKGDGQLLAEWVHYGATGGWLSRRLSTPGGGGLLVRQQCMPDVVQRSEISQLVLPFDNRKGASNER
jgi:hypothetical protein